MKGQKCPRVANQRWLCVSFPWSPVCLQSIPKEVYYVKVTSLRLQWMHWVETPNTVLYMEEKPRGEKSFWWVSTDWPWSEGNQEMSAAQHQDRKASGTISTYFRGLPGGAIYYPEQETGGLSVTLMCKQLRGIHRGPASTLMINHSAFFACLAFLTSDWTAQLIHQTHHGTMWPTGVSFASG